MLNTSKFYRLRMSVPLDAVVAVRQTDAGGVTAALVVNGHAGHTRSVAGVDLQIRREAAGTQTNIPAYKALKYIYHQQQWPS